MRQGLVFLPFLVRWGLPDLAGVGWRRGLVLLIVGGPCFALLQTGGYAFAPLSHGAVIAPSAVTILSTLFAAGFLRERLNRAHIIGALLVLMGIMLTGFDGLTAAPIGARVWIGDLMFLVSSMMWAWFSVLVRHWQLDAARGVAVVSVLSLAVTVPGYAVLVGTAHLWTVPPSALAFQGLIQGGLQGVIGITAYSHTVRMLGVSRAVLFPALVPAVSILIGIPTVGEIPGPTQLAGLAAVMIGLLTAVGAFGSRRGNSKPS